MGTFSQFRFFLKFFGKKILNWIFLEVELLTEKIETAKQEERNNELNDEISNLLKQKEEIFAKAETVRQRHVEEKNRVAPIIIENEILTNKNQLLEQKLNGAQREIANLHNQLWDLNLFFLYLNFFELFIF